MPKQTINDAIINNTFDAAILVVKDKMFDAKLHDAESEWNQACEAIIESLEELKT